MSTHAQGQLEHKLVPLKMRLSLVHSPHQRRSARVHSSPRAHGNTTSPRAPHSPPVMRDTSGTQTDQPDAVTPVMIVGICLASAALLGLGIFLIVRWQRKRTQTSRTIERGIKTARMSANGRGQPEMGQAWWESGGGNASDDTHVVDFVYGDKVRSSFESSDYNALSSNPKAVSRAAVTASVILPTSAARSHPILKAIDVQRANHPLSAAPTSSPLAAPAPPAFFPSTPSSVHTFYGPAIARARTDSDAGHSQPQGQGQGLAATSAMRALAVAAGIGAPSSPVSPSFGAEKEKEKAGEEEAFELPVYFSPFRASKFGDGMKLGEHLGIQMKQGEEKDQPESVRSKDSRWFSQDSTRLSHSHDDNQGPGDATPPKQSSPKQSKEIVPASPGARPGTAGTFGQPLSSFGPRIPYRTTGHRHAASSLSIADVRSVRISYASGQSSPLAGAFKGHSPSPSFSHGRTQSSGSAMGVTARKILTVFPPLLPDELVLSAGERVTLLQTFDDEWCVVGRDRFGEVEIGAVPAYVFTKLPTGENIQRPMRSTSLGVQIEMSSMSTPGAAWSSREEVISWSNF